METIIRNGKVVTPAGIIERGFVRIENWRITGTGEADPEVSGEAEIFDARGGWISPGLCDIHTHGCGGHWSFFGAADTLKAAMAMARSGVTAFLPTTVSLPHKQVLNSIGEIKKAMAAQRAGADPSAPPRPDGEDGARILGIHLEGPYINPIYAGAHIPTAIRNPVPAETEDILREAGDALRIVTLAPELPGGLEFVSRLRAAGVVVSIGHSDATSEQTHVAVGKGASHITHVFNAIRMFHHREPGVAFSALVDPRVTIEIILDHKHVHADAAAVAIRAKGPAGSVLVSDSISPAGLGDGVYNVWGFDVTVKDGAARIPTGNLAGSVITLNRAVKNAMALPGISPADAFMMATANPYRVIGMDGKNGALAPGMPADIAVFDEGFDCMATFVAGRCVFRKDA